MDFSLWFGVKNDGGAAFQAQGGLKKAEDISKLGWAAIDVLSIGVEIEVGLFVRIEVCLPIVGCEGWTLIDLNFELPIGFPLGGATHQLVAEQKHALKILTDWGKLDQSMGPMVETLMTLLTKDLSKRSILRLCCGDKVCHHRFMAAPQT